VQTLPCIQILVTGLAWKCLGMGKQFKQLYLACIFVLGVQNMCLTILYLWEKPNAVFLEFLQGFSI